MYSNVSDSLALVVDAGNRYRCSCVRKGSYHMWLTYGSRCAAAMAAVADSADPMG